MRTFLSKKKFQFFKLKFFASTTYKKQVIARNIHQNVNPRHVPFSQKIDGKKLEIDGKELVPTEKPNHKRKKIDEEKSEGEISEGDEDDEEKRNPKDNVENI